MQRVYQGYVRGCIAGYLLEDDFIVWCVQEVVTMV